MCGHWVYMIIITVRSRVLSLTYDDQYLLTGAGDGTFLYIKLIYQQTVQPQLLSRSVLYV